MEAKTNSNVESVDETMENNVNPDECIRLDEDQSIPTSMDKLNSSDESVTMIDNSGNHQEVYNETNSVMIFDEITPPENALEIIAKKYIGSSGCYYCGFTRRSRMYEHCFRFPLQEIRANIWIRNSGCLELLAFDQSQLNHKLRFCERHFETSQFKNELKKSLNWNAVPTLFEGREKVPILDSEVPFDIRYSYKHGKTNSSTVKRKLECNLPSDVPSAKRMTTDPYLNMINEQMYSIKPVSAKQAKLASVGPPHTITSNLPINLQDEELYVFDESLDEVFDASEHVVETGNVDQALEDSPAKVVSAAELCRLCASANGKMIEIQSREADAVNLSAMIDTVLPFCKISKDVQEMPTQVCTNCVRHLDAAYKLIDRVLWANDLLTTMVKAERGDDAVEGQETLETKLWKDEDAHDCDQTPEIINIGDDLEEEPMIKIEEIKPDAMPATIATAAVKIQEEAAWVQRDEQAMNETPVYACTLCDEVFKNRARLRIHTNVTHQVYICKRCKGMFSSKDELMKHVDETYFRKCYFCDLRIPKKCKINYRRHITLKHADKLPKYLINTTGLKGPIHCTLCPRKSMSILIIKRHYFFDHCTYMCEICMSRFDNAMDQYNHCIEIHEIPCSYCPQKFYTRLTYSLHYNSIHKSNVKERMPAPVKEIDDVFECCNCKRGFKTNISLKRHYYWCHGKYACEVCLRTFTQVEHEADHYFNEHGYLCYCCMENFVNDYEFKLHLNHIHPDFKQFNCYICIESFKEHEELVMHLQEHKFNGNFLCEQCGHTCSSESNHKKHMYKHQVDHQEKLNLECNVCKQKFTYKTSLENHMRLHIERLKYTCPHCELIFTNKQKLAIHVNSQHKVIKTEPIIKCTKCNYTCSSKNKLNIHLKTKHPYKYNCNKCLQKFTTKQLCKQHIKKNHPNTHMFVCNLCKYKAFHENQMNKHCSRQHNGVMTYFKTNAFCCDVCHKRFNLKQLLDSHKMRDHSEKTKQSEKVLKKLVKESSQKIKRKKVETVLIPIINKTNFKPIMETINIGDVKKTIIKLPKTYAKTNRLILDKQGNVVAAVSNKDAVNDSNKDRPSTSNVFSDYDVSKHNQDVIKLPIVYKTNDESKQRISLANIAQPNNEMIVEKIQNISNIVNPGADVQ